MFTISNQSDYAMLFLEYLARENKSVSLAKAVKELGLPRRFMAHVASKLVVARMLESHEGVHGGYKLVKPLKKIKLYELLRIFEGDMKLVKCSDNSYDCQWKKVCNHKDAWQHKLQKKFISVIDSLSVADMMAKSSF